MLKRALLHKMKPRTFIIFIRLLRRKAEVKEAKAGVVAKNKAVVKLNVSFRSALWPVISIENE